MQLRRNNSDLRLPRLLFAAALTSALLAAEAAHAQPGEASRSAGTHENVLRVMVQDVRSSRGHVRVDVCTRSEFLSRCRYSGSAPATRGVTMVEVGDLPPGVYAVQAYEDRNDNRAVDRNLIGIPTEAVGFSNDAPVRLHGPSFGAASFTFAGGEQTISLRLRRFFR
jgi:uncharacterized protein (DUF2141 family)